MKRSQIPDRHWRRLVGGAAFVVAMAIASLANNEQVSAATAPEPAASCSSSIQHALRFAGLPTRSPYWRQALGPAARYLNRFLPPEVDGTAHLIAPLDSVIASASTSYEDSHPSRAFNVELAARRLDGATVERGETFSLLEQIGPLDLESGYQVAFGIVADERGEPQTVDSVAGGVSQVATTLYQAVFWAGYEVVERIPHAYWIDRYVHAPTGLLGIEATVDQSGVDFQFRNGGPGPLTIRAQAEDDQLTIALVGQAPDWTVRVVRYAVDNVRPAANGVFVREALGQRPGTRYLAAEAACGFDVDLVREVSSGQSGRRVLRAPSRYAPAHRVVVVAGRAW